MACRESGVPRQGLLAHDVARLVLAIAHQHVGSFVRERVARVARSGGDSDGVGELGPILGVALEPHQGELQSVRFTQIKPPSIFTIAASTIPLALRSSPATQSTLRAHLLGSGAGTELAARLRCGTTPTMRARQRAASTRSEPESRFP